MQVEQIEKKVTWQFQTERARAILGASLGIGTGLGLSLAAAASGEYAIAVGIFINAGLGAVSSKLHLESIHEQYNR